MKPQRPFLSVIVPVKNGEHVLQESLPALERSTLPREYWELIVCDDVSTDETALIAGRFADIVIRLTGNSRGPAYARNRGAERARGECLVFFDADIVVAPDTLGRIAQVMATEPDVAAVFGSYDDAPAARGIVSQYRNLLHHYVHGQNCGEAHTFWAGCGAVRRSVFMAAGMYDEWRFPRPQVEDIELGHRIRALNQRIVLRPEIQVKHLKRWTLRNMLATDFNDRGVPWTRLLVEEGTFLSGKQQRSKALNLRTREKILTLLVSLTGVILLEALLVRDARLLVIVPFLLAPALWCNRQLYAFFLRKRGPFFAICALPLHLAYYALNSLAASWGLILTHILGEPRQHPTVDALSELGVETWPPVPLTPKRPTRVMALPSE